MVASQKLRNHGHVSSPCSAQPQSTLVIGRLLRRLLHTHPVRQLPPPPSANLSLVLITPLLALLVYLLALRNAPPASAGAT